MIFFLYEKRPMVVIDVTQETNFNKKTKSKV